MSDANRTTLMVHSPERDRLVAALSVALGSAAMGMNVTMYFTFGGLSALRRPRPRSWLSTVVARMRARGPQPPPVAELVALAQSMGVRLIACETSMPLVGLTRADLIDGLSYGGVATYLADATDSTITLFV